ncbi:hypothetical protein Tco_0996099, partial [Tanacetum coccineum]
HFLTRLYNHILQKNPQAIVPLARFTFHEHVMDPLDISRNPSKEKGKKIASPLKSLSPPQAPSKSISSKSTHYTSSSSLSESPTPNHVAPLPKLCFVIPIKQEPQELPPLQISPNDPYAQTMDNWPPSPSNPSPPPRISRPLPGFPNPPPGFEPLPSTQPLFVNINNNTPLLYNNVPPLENIHHPPPNLGNQDFPNPLNILDFTYTTISSKLVDMIIDYSAITNGVWERLKYIFLDNKDALVIQLDNEIRNMAIGSFFVNDTFKKSSPKPITLLILVPRSATVLGETNMGNDGDKSMSASAQPNASYVYFQYEVGLSVPSLTDPVEPVTTGPHGQGDPTTTAITGPHGPCLG